VKLHQLRYLAAIVQNGFNITTAAQKLHTSQPGVSKQIRLLEEELGLQIFARDARGLTGLTPAGAEVTAHALTILREARSIRGLASELHEAKQGSLSIGTTHTQARYVLPPVVSRFRGTYPDVQLHLHQGTSEQIAEMAGLDRIDFAIATGSKELFSDFVLLPAYHWHRRLIVPRDHPLATGGPPTLEQLAKFPIVTYVFSFTGPSSLEELFASHGLEVKVGLTARDADVIKTYVRLGLGVGIVASVAVDPELDRDLVSIDASHLLARHTTWIGFRSGTFLRGYMYDFIQSFAPHLTRELVRDAAAATDPAARDALFASIELPQL
jgi:LysR family cys regulon transcriptional activator